MLADSGFLHQLEHHAFSLAGEPMALYGDPAYPLRVHLQVPYRCAGMSPQMEAYNKAMSAVRISVEWLFGDILNYFKFQIMFTVGNVDRYIGRHSIDIAVDSRSTVSRLSIHWRSRGGRLSIDSRQTVD